MKTKTLLWLVGVFLAISVKAMAAQQLVIGADEWPDYTNKDGTGVYFDIIKQVFSDFELKYKTAPFHKTLENFSQGDLDIVVGVYQDDVSNAFLPDWFLDTEYPIVAFYDKKQTQIVHPSDFVKLHVSWLRGYHFERYLSSARQTTLVEDINDGFKLLAANKIDAFIDYPYNLTEKEQQRYSSFEIFPARHVYVAFQHNRFGKMLAKQFDAGMARLRAAGTLAKLFQQEYPHSQLADFTEEKQKMIMYVNSVSLFNGGPSNLVDSSNSLNLNFLLDQLDHYEFQYKLINDLTEMYRYTELPNVCISDLIKTPERSKYFLASEPFSLFLGLRLYSSEKLPIDGEIDLNALLDSNSHFRIGTASGRSYGKALDEQLSKVNGNQIIKSPSNIESLFKQLNKNRFNLLIEYPSIKAANWNDNNPPLYSYKIAGADDYILGHIMCTKSEQNQKFIRDFNRSLTNLHHSAAFFDAQYRRMLDENKLDFINYFNEAFGNQAEQPIPMAH